MSAGDLPGVIRTLAGRVDPDLDITPSVELALADGDQGVKLEALAILRRASDSLRNLATMTEAVGCGLGGAA